MLDTKLDNLLHKIVKATAQGPRTQAQILAVLGDSEEIRQGVRTLLARGFLGLTLDWRLRVKSKDYRPVQNEDFQKELANLINKHSLEQRSDTPDFILAEYLVGCLDAFNNAAKDQATADHAAIMEEVFYTACERRTAWNSSNS